MMAFEFWLSLWILQIEILCGPGYGKLLFIAKQDIDSFFFAKYSDNWIWIIKLVTLMW